jgi:dipeptidyl aminopeptidase/acylaminoacyl peptidase
MYRHWDSWEDGYFSHIFIAKFENGIVSEGADIMTGERFDSPMMPWGGMEQIAWSPDGKRLAYTCKKLKGLDYAISTNSEIFLYDLDAKTTENLSKGNDGFDQEPAFAPDGSALVWASMQTPGFEADKNRIMYYNFADKKMVDLTTAFDQSSATFKWHPTEKDVLYFISGINATYQVYNINVKTKAIKQMTAGNHDYTELAVGTKAVVGLRMSLSEPSEIFSLENATPYASEKQLSFTNKPILDNITMGKVEERWITTTDNKKMLTWVVYPPDFDRTRQYPTLLYCQGGPQSAVSQFWSYRWNLQIMAANGYIVVAPNRRGLPTFGQEWNDQISGDYGGQNMKDYLSAIDEVSKEPFVDKYHRGAVGASYGGYSVYWLAGHHEGRFRAFIAHCGMFNLESWYGCTEEYWFPDYDLGGEYWRSPVPQSYDFSPHKFVGNWDAPLLVIHGGKDFRIPYTEGMQAFNAAQLKGVPSRFLFFPNESHFVTKPQNSVLWQREFFRWLDQWLKE